MSKLPILNRISSCIFYLLNTLILLLPSTHFAQTKDPFQLNDLINTEQITRKSIFGLQSHEKNANKTLRYYKLDPNGFKNLREEFYPLIATKIPIDKDQNPEFLFTEYDFFTSDFAVNLIQDGLKMPISVDKGIHLKGKIQGDDNSFSSISLFQGEIYGSAFTSDGNRISIVPFETGNPLNMKCAIIDDRKISKQALSAGCITDDIQQYMGNENELELRISDNCKSVVVSVDIDYDLFIKFNGNVQSITNYVTGLFNNVQTLYKRENISIALAQINIHSAKDNFAHITANEDLENFRKKYPNTNKTLKILLSGYSKSGQATLGGIANIGTICLPTYSYGFANVVGNYINAPVYSWDVFLVTHELGHILGSKHTHACAWGPNKNQAIDNCAKLEGSCPSPGIPLKGTMMSYCYLTGMPGIDLSLGFGKEPGDLIRSKVKSSSCLSSYIPTNKTLDKANTEVEANLECTDGAYTYYYFDNNTIDPKDDILILSVAKNGNDIGTIGDGNFNIKLVTTINYSVKKANQITAAYVDKTKSWFVSNKYWDIKSIKKITKPIDIRYYYNVKDFEDLKGSVGTLNNTDIKLFNLLPPANINPESNHANAQTQQFIQYPSSAKKTVNSYLLTNPETNIYCMELNTAVFASSGFGAYTSSQKFVNFIDQNILYTGNQANINFKTNREINCIYFVIEKSNDQIHFDSIGKVNARGNSGTLVSYKFNSLQKEMDHSYFRIKAFSKNHEYIYSPVFTKDIGNFAKNELSIYPNPVKTGMLFVEYTNHANSPEADIDILDIYGRTQKTFKYNLIPGDNYLNINTTDLQNGLHYISISSKSDVQKTGFTINQ